MLTSNIIKHLKQQNWGAAIIDFIVVVSGIFVAIQVNSWNDGLVNKQKEKVILEQLYSDFSSNVESISSMATFHQNKAEELDYVIDMVATDNIDSASDRARNALMSMFQMPPISASMGTYKSLIATGDIGLIQDQQLKTLLIDLESHLESEKSMLAYFRQMNDLEMNYVRGLVSVQPNHDNSGTFINVDFERFNTDKNLLTVVANQERSHLIFSRIRGGVAQKFDKVKSYIGKQLNKVEG
ncbi:hypothetical protein RGQ13_01800 [Thalassotalea psychrophila]|uniref:Pilus assembly protein n=1 Tax=Thalassotalea psychrophila TaxID=3065647 RepID=A0ABY9TY67_9GAMM|nr:hypothetical protein RGQ13_01800 [Colwelliaceae bacterium SQ149]